MRVQLPEFAAFFEPELGCNFQRGVNRDAPPGLDGEQRYYVQPKEASGIFPSQDEPEVRCLQSAQDGHGGAVQREGGGTEVVATACIAEAGQ